MAPDSRLALGTVQLGMPYGISRTGGRPDQLEALAIVEAARDGGIDTLDTAEAYGEAEEVLGTAGVAGFRVVSKISAVPEQAGDVAEWMRAAVEGSLARLGVTRLHAVLLHAPDQLLGPRGPEIAAGLAGVRRAGLTRLTGFSIYGPEPLEAMCALHRPGLVQAPFNVLDRRIVASGWAARLKAAGCELHTRSTFLQGLLLMPPDRRPAQFARWSGLWAAWDGWLAETGLTATEACLRFALSEPMVDRVVVGVETAAQLGALLAVPAAPLPSEPPLPPVADLDLIDPSRWERT